MKKIDIAHWISMRSIWPPWQEEKLGSLARGMTNAAGISLFAMMIMMTLHVVGRKMEHPVPGAFEASEQLMVVLFSFPLAEIGLRKGHIIFELIARYFPLKVQERLNLVNHSVGLILFAPLTYQAWMLAWKMYSMGEYRQGIIDFPIWPFRIVFAIGLSVFTFQLMVSWIRERKPGKSERAGKSQVSAGVVS